MEKLQGPINPCLLDVGCLDGESEAMAMSMSYRFEDPYSEEQGIGPHYNTLPSLEDKMPFLQMLQGIESHQQHQQVLLQSPPFFPLMQEPNFQLLLRLQHQKLSTISCFTEQLESCVTNNNNNISDICDMVKSEFGLRDKDVEMTRMPPKCDQPQVERAMGRSKRAQLGVSGAGGDPKERRKRKRTSRPTKNREEVESQRMTHIAVERNRRRQMNEHLSALRSLMPPSYVQRGDQASIIGGAIDFVKELEQLLQSLQAQKRMRQSEENGDVSASSSTSSSSNLLGSMNMFMAPQPPSTSSSSSPLHFGHPHCNSHTHEEGNGNGNEVGKGNEEFSAENRSALADIEVVVIQNHVNLKIQCQRRPGQLLKAIVALEQLRLSVLHLNITSLHSLVHYSFNLKIEEDCKLGSADEVASAVHQIFSLINMT